MVEVKRRRKKGPPALGNIYETKQIATEMIDAQTAARMEKTERLRLQRLSGLGQIVRKHPPLSKA